MQIVGLFLMVFGFGDYVTFEFGSYIITMPTGAVLFIWGTLKAKKLSDLI